MGLAGRAGAEGLELTLAHGAALSADTPLARCDEWRRQGKEVAVRLVVIRCLFPADCDFGHDEAERRQQARAWVSAALERAARLGAECLHVAPACLAMADASGAPPEVDYADALNRTYESLSELWPAAERCGVVLCVVPATGRFLLSPLETRALLDRVNSAYVGAALDWEAVARVGHPPAWIRTLGQRMAVVRVGGQEPDLSAALKALAAVHFRGSIVLTGPADDDALTRAREVLARALP